MLKKLIPGIIDRGVKLTQLGLNFSLKELELSLPRSKEDFLKLKEKQIKDLISILGDLKGASMKMGQALTLDLIETWPSEIKPLIQNISFKAKPRPTKEMEEVLRKELGEKFGDLFELSPEALASASIGQVHSIKLGNEKAAIKIQYPGILNSLESDIKVFRLIVLGISKLYQKDSINLQYFFEEIESSLSKECDYTNELRQLKRFSDFVKEDDVFIVPKPFEKYCTSKILLMNFCEGMTFDQWLSSKPSEEHRQFVARELLRLLILEIFHWGLVQSDAHGGNFLFRPLEKKIVLLDFGSTKELTAEFQHQYKESLKYTFQSDWVKLKEHVIKIGWIDPRESEETFNFFKEMMSHLVTAFRGEFDFKDEKYLKTSQKNAWDFARSCKFSPPPRDIIFVHRKLGGIFFLLRRLEAKVDLSDFIKELHLDE